MAVLKEVVIDSTDPYRLAQFWSAVLSGYNIRGYDDAELTRLGRAGFTPETDPAVAVDGPGPTLFFQISDTRKRFRNRIHFDVSCDNREKEVARLSGLGASVRDVHDEFTVMLDPEGNEFCVKEV